MVRDLVLGEEITHLNGDIENTSSKAGISLVRSKQNFSKVKLDIVASTDEAKAIVIERKRGKSGSGIEGW